MKFPLANIMVCLIFGLNRCFSLSFNLSLTHCSSLPCVRSQGRPSYENENQPCQFGQNHQRVSGCLSISQGLQVQTPKGRAEEPSPFAACPLILLAASWTRCGFTLLHLPGTLKSRQHHRASSGHPALSYPSLGDRCLPWNFI